MRPGGPSRRDALAAGTGLLAASMLPCPVRAASQGNAPVRDTVLWYRAPANEWTEALPVGNGRMGAMIFGGVARERLQLNENTLWAGGPYEPQNPQALAALPEVRRLIFEGRYAEAQAMAQERMMATPIRQMSYQTIGDLMLTFGASSQSAGYRRELDLDAAVATTTYTRDGVAFRREVFASAPAGVIVMRLTADRPGAIRFRAAFETPQPGEATAEGRDLVLAGRNTSQHDIPARLEFQCRARVLADAGTVTADGDALEVEGADAVTLLISAATSYRSYDDVSGAPAAIVRDRLDRAEAQGLEALREAHLIDHRALFRRAAIDLGRTPAADNPTDQRVRASQSSDDPALAALYFHYARYLLIASSRPGGQPANLQGLWNDKLSPPWGSKYTININTEMNYWPAEPTGLQECVQPLIDMIRDLSVTGRKTAWEHYGARGWVCHHNTDGWRATAPIDGARFGMWPMGGAWLCEHLWDHWDYGRDRAFLADAYPLMKGAALFFVDALIEDPKTGELVTSPSLSPENLHPFGAAVCAGPAMDSQILRDLFSHTIQAAELLDLDPDFCAECAAALARLPADRIGQAGQLQEWREDWDLQAPEPAHRHVSHLYAVYPSRQINVRATPALAAAGRKSLELRGDLSTGWAIAWRINLWARLRDGDHAHSVVNLLLGPERTYPNLFDAHPPFQIDGNFGGAAGILELLVQQLDEGIDLLPALPSAWPTGSIRGVRVRGGHELDLEWTKGEPAAVTVRSKAGGDCLLRWDETEQRLRLRPGGAARLRWSGGQFHGA